MAATNVTQTFSTPGSSTYTVPSGNWYVVSCYIAGGGGGGGAGADGYGGGGGGSSAFALKNGCAILLSGGNTISYTVGSGGASGSDGTASSVSFNGTSFSTGFGQAGTAGSGSGGGIGGGSTDTGGTGNDAGFSDVGGDGAGGAAGGVGSVGTAGVAPGGGGGGGADGFSGGAGANGRVTFTLLAADVMGANVDPFIAIAGTNLTIQASTLVEGDVGAVSAVSITDPSVVHGTIHTVNDSATQTAITDSTTVYNFLRTLPAISDFTGFALGADAGSPNPDLRSLPPGVYSWSGLAQVINNFTLNGAGIYVFQVTSGGGIPGTFRVENGSQMILGTGARPENVYFVTQSGIDVRASASALGTYLTPGNITANPVGTLFMYGRLVSTAGAVTVGRMEGRLPTTFCYAKSTGILTERGYVPIEEILLDDKVIAKGSFGPNGKVQFMKPRSKKVTFVGKFTIAHINKKTAPICFKAGSLSENVPFKDLIVSPNHAIVHNGSKLGAECFLNDDTIYRMTELPIMEYYVIELEDHSVIDANGALSESMLGDSSAFISIHEPKKVEMHLPISA